MVNKTYCDICGKEIEYLGDAFSIKISSNKRNESSDVFDETCEECKGAVLNFIKGMRK